MSLSVNNITYEKIMTPLRQKLRTEFKGSLPIYFDNQHRDIGTKYLRIYPTSQDLQEKRTGSYLNLYNLQMDYVIKTKQKRKDEKVDYEEGNSTCRKYG